MVLPYADRSEAGRRLAAEMQDYAGRTDLLILALPRGGVPVAFEVAEALDAPFDLMLVRKLGLPGHEELAMGAIAFGGVRVLNEQLVRRLQVPPEIIDEVAEREGIELRRRERAYRGDRSAPELRDRCVVLIDDGLATGATMLAAVKAVRQSDPESVIVAVPVAPQETIEEFSDQPGIDRIICPKTPPDFGGVGRWYEDFSQTTDQEVRDLLSRAWSRQNV
jgi:predicted phosphoribosyltransferase